MDTHTLLSESTVATAPSPASSGTVLSVPAGEGARYPTGNFDVLVCPADGVPGWAANGASGGNFEVCRCTSRSGDALTVVRAQYGSSAQPIASGWRIYQPVMPHDFLDAIQPSAVNPNSGYYADFALGAPGTDITINDPRSNTKWAGVLVSGGGVVPTYDPAPTTLLTPPLPGAARFINNTPATSSLYWDFHTLGEHVHHHGRVYVRIGGNPAQHIQLVHWQGRSQATASITITPGREILLTNAVAAEIGRSTILLTANTWYRIEWEVTHHPTTGAMQVKIFSGHSTTPLQTLTVTNTNTGTVMDTGLYGNVNNSNLDNTPHWIAALADCFNNPVGPYTGEPTDLWLVEDDDGKKLFAIDNNGELVFYASKDVGYPLGYYHYTAFKGDEMGRIDTQGNVMVGKNLNAGPPGIAHSGAYFWDTLLHGASGRAVFASIELLQTNDPPDITGTRSSALMGNSEKVGTDASVTNGSTLLTIPSANFHTADKGKTVGIDGVGYLMTQITSKTTATISPAYAGTSGTKPWELHVYPYPDTMGANADGEALFQLRWQPMIHPFVRDGTNGVTNGTTTFTSATGAFTSADVNRKILLNNNVAQIYTIIGVTNATTITLDRAGPAAASSVPWSISKNRLEGGAYRAGTLSGTIGAYMRSDARTWGPNKLHMPMDIFVSLTRDQLEADGTGGAAVLWFRGKDSSVEVVNHLRLGEGVTDSELWREAVGRIRTNALLNASPLGLATKVKAGTPVDGDWPTTPPDGTVVIDSAASKIWVRIGGVWKGAVLS